MLELRPVLVFLWAKILAVDGSCQQDLVREQSHKYFLAVLQDAAMLPDHKTWSVFVLSSIVHGYKPGQDEAKDGNLITLCLNELDDQDPVLRQWLAICLGRIWDKHEDARWRGARDNAPEQLFNLLSDPVPEVRAAAVYALGTFLNSCGKRTDHANSLDQTIGLKLLQMTQEDGSSLVRRELIVALQWIVSTFLPTFVNLCKALMEEDEKKMRQSGIGRPVSPKPGLMSRAISEDKMRRKSEMPPPQQRKTSRLLQDTASASISMIANSTSFSEIPNAVVGDNVVSGSNPRKSRKCLTPSLTSSYSALASLSTFTSTSKFKPFFLKVWGGLLLLEKDPDPSVALLARALLDLVWRKMVEKDRATDIQLVGSHIDLRSQSAPNSPVRPTFMIGESPPSNMNTTLPANLEPVATENGRNTGSWMQRSIIPDINEEGMLIEEGESSAISTQFIEWSSRYFSTQLMTLNESSDLESESYWKREWLFSRNNNLLRTAEAERRSVLDGSGKLDEHIGVARSTQIPSVIAMHPHDQEVIVAGRDTISTHDFSQPLQQRPVSFHNKNPKISQITALEFINGHEDGLLVSGSDDGVVRVYKDWQREHKLVTAWNLLPELVPQAVAGNRISCGLCLAWHQKEQLLAGAGDTKYVRLWDCQTEVKLVDLPSATDSIVTNLSVNDEHGLLAASYYDGSIRLYDPRSPAARARVMMYREHGKPIVACKNQNNWRLVSGCTDGKVKVWDVRRQSSISTFETGQNLLLLDIHQSAPLFAGWTMSSQLNVYNLNSGELHHQFRYHEGILGHRLGSINCIRFHPNLLRLAAGTAESEISLFGYKKL